MKKRNVIAKDLRTPKYRPRIVKGKYEYTRKVKHKSKSPDDQKDHQGFSFNVSYFYYWRFYCSSIHTQSIQIHPINQF